MHRRTGKLFALKNLEHERFPTHQFLRELRFLLSLQHPNIVTCHAIEHTQTGRYLVMDYCEGGTLRGLMVDDVALSLAQCIQIVADVLCGLASAHQQGIVHCDIKPENILLTLQAKGWSAKISDFGIARLNKEVYSQNTGNTGSPAYMAPERFYSQYSAASDIYAVGVLLFELLVGRRPFSGPPKALMKAHLNQPVVCPDEIPAGLQGVIGMALQKLPARRFQSALEMLNAMLSVVSRMDGVLAKAMSIEVPLLTLRQGIPYYDSESQREDDSKYAAKNLHGLSLLSSEAVDLSFIGYTSSTTFTYRGITAIGSEDGNDHRNNNANNGLNAVKGNDNNGPTYDVVTLKSVLTDATYRHRTFVAKDHNLGWRSLQLPDPIQQLLPAPQGYFLATCNTIYWVNPADLPFSEPDSGAASPLSDAGSLTAHPIYKLDQDCIAAIEPEGHWVALITDLRNGKRKKGDASTLSFHPLPRRAGRMALPKASARLRVAGRSKQLLQAIALNIRHVAIISDGPHPKAQQVKFKQAKSQQISANQPASEIINPRPLYPSTMSRATYIEVFTRRGQRIALRYLPMCLGTVITTPKPYRILATDRYDPTSILCIDLKPFRIQRFVLDIKPQFLAATDWGYIAADVTGNIVFLDTNGFAVSALHGPANLTAMAFLAPKWLFLSTWNDGAGCLHTLDLKQQITHWIF